MFYPIYQLQGYDQKEHERVRERWDDPTNKKAKDLVLELIRKGGGEDFLQWDFEQGSLKGLLDNDRDLKGIPIFGENIEFPTADNFEAIDFSYSQFHHSTFKNCCLYASFRFAKIYNCRFISCIFRFAYWHGCTIENSAFQDCDFIEYNRFINCDFVNCQFPNYSTSGLLFSDCRFDLNTKIDNPKSKMITREDKESSFNRMQLCDYYKSIYEAYHVGNAPNLTRDYKYLSRKYGTKYLSKNWLWWFKDKLLIELLTGYGLKPIRPLLGGLTTIVVFSFIFGLHRVAITIESFLKEIGHVFLEGLRFSASAFTALGGASELAVPYNYLLLLEYCLGVIFFGLFVTVLSNVWFTE